MSTRFRSLSVGPLRAFEALSRTLNFRLAAEELHITQPAVSRQIQALEDEVGVRLVERDRRRVEVTPAGAALLQSLRPWLARLDGTVRQIRQGAGREAVTVSTFASMATLWLVPRLERLRAFRPMDVRILSRDQILPAEGPGPGAVDAFLRYCRPEDAPAGAVRLFDEVIAPIAAPQLAVARRGPLRAPADLAAHTLIEDLDLLPSTEYRSWSAWLREAGLPELQPAHGLYFTLAHQQVQACAAGQGVAMGRLALVLDGLRDGALVEPFAARAGARRASPYAYWLIAPQPAAMTETVRVFCEWVQAEAALTREQLRGYLAGEWPRPRRSARASP
jgi:LysR family glycine cleavage system transcriptional activator